MTTAAYPQPGCTGRDSCKPCRAARLTFRCTKCRRSRPWCVGAGDAHPGWCDGCWYARHKGKRPCNACKEYDKRRAL